MAELKTLETEAKDDQLSPREIAEGAKNGKNVVTCEKAEGIEGQKEGSHKNSIDKEDNIVENNNDQVDKVEFEAPIVVVGGTMGDNELPPETIEGVKEFYAI